MNGVLAIPTFWLPVSVYMGQHLLCVLAGSKMQRTEDDVEPLHPGHAVDEVEAAARVRPNVAHDEEHVLVVAADRAV